MKASSTPPKRKRTPLESDVTALNVDRDVIRHPSADLGRIRAPVTPPKTQSDGLLDVIIPRNDKPRMV
jgi:hypothetical protein